MSKKTTLFGVTCVLLAVVTFFGVRVYTSLHNTPEQVTQTFVRDLEQGNTTQAYARLTAELKQNREQYWKDYFAQFKAAEGDASLVSQESVKDTFNTYAAGSDTQRFTYKFRLQGKDYILQIVTFKLQSVWVVAELSGTYR